MSEINNLIFEDYAQSANSLFNFMKEEAFLYDMLEKKAVLPRYCEEDIAYLNIKNDGTEYKSISVLQKCFCDIPLHKLTQQFNLDVLNDDFNEWSDEEKKEVDSFRTHVGLYGLYGISFSKTWCEKNNLQPIHYVNQEADATKSLSENINMILTEDEIDDFYAEDIICRLAFIKPIRGIMNRKVNCSKDNKKVIIRKNFHDEKEWRYVPNRDKLRELNINSIVANKNVFALDESMQRTSNRLQAEMYRSLWLEFKYEDIRYLIVPDNMARIRMINAIKKLDDNKFGKHEGKTDQQIILEKDILISKIVVLSEVGKDW